MKVFAVARGPLTALLELASAAVLLAAQTDPPTWCGSITDEPDSSHEGAGTIAADATMAVLEPCPSLAVAITFSTAVFPSIAVLLKPALAPALCLAL